MREQLIFCIGGNLPLLTGQAMYEAAHFIVDILSITAHPMIIHGGY